MLRAAIPLTALLLAAGCGPCDDGAVATGPAATAETVAFEVDGMHCGSCVAAITAAVKDLDGVRDCTVSLEERSARVVVVDAAAPERVLAKLKAMGYGAERRAAE